MDISIAESWVSSSQCFGKCYLGKINQGFIEEIGNIYSSGIGQDTDQFVAYFVKTSKSLSW